MNELTPAEHERLRDDLAAYALDALEAEEAAAIERHLDECQACQERLGWLQPAVDLLPASVDQIAPPDRLRASLLDTVRAESAPSQGKTTWDAIRRRWTRRNLGLALRPATGLATVILLLLGTGIGYLVRGDTTTERSVVKAETPRTLARDVSATLERHGDSATLHVQEMPKLDTDEVYEVWVQRAGAVEPSSLFVVDRNGTAAAAVPGPLADAEAVLVTREPRGGSQQPTNPPLLKAPIN